MSFVTEERSVFRGLTTLENLRVGRGDVAWALELFPELRPRLSTSAGLLSGGEQQMLTLARALSRRPQLLLADELSLGLAPQAVERLLEAVRGAVESGISVLVVEQHTNQVLNYVDRAYVMVRGKIVMSGVASNMAKKLGEVESAYFLSEKEEADEGLGEM